MSSEAYAYHRPDLLETPELYPPSLRHRLLTGALYTAAEYLDAQRARMALCRDVAATMRGYDLLLSPTRGSTAMTFEQAWTDYMAPVSYTSLFNLTGQPALNVLCGFASDGLPIGLQLAGKPFDEVTVLRAGHTYEQAAGWKDRRPPV